MAYALAILDAEDIPHPRLEFVCTVCEEVAWKRHSPGCFLPGRDTAASESGPEEEEAFWAGCAGGCTAQICRRQIHRGGERNRREQWRRR